MTALYTDIQTNTNKNISTKPWLSCFYDIGVIGRTSGQETEWALPYNLGA